MKRYFRDEDRELLDVSGETLDTEAADWIQRSESKTNGINEYLRGSRHGFNEPDKILSSCNLFDSAKSLNSSIRCPKAFAWPITLAQPRLLPTG
jgi:hypothetical protein